MKIIPYLAAAAPLLMVLTVFMVLPALAVPASARCLDEVHAMAESHGITSKPPVAVPGAKQGPAVTTHELQRSGGVIAPPQADDRSVIKPPTNADPGMATLPDAKPSPGAQGGTTTGGKRTALQAALTAARASADRGDEQACEESLAKAKQLAEQE